MFTIEMEDGRKKPMCCIKTQKNRRKRADMIQTFKIVNGFDNVDKNTWFKFVDVREKVTR